MNLLKILGVCALLLGAMHGCQESRYKNWIPEEDSPNLVTEVKVGDKIIYQGDTMIVAYSVRWADVSVSMLYKDKIGAYHEISIRKELLTIIPQK